MSGRRRVVFHDTSVLINFHRAGLLPALGALLGADVSWVATVKVECERKERELPLPGLTVAAHALLGDPLAPEGAEHRAIRVQRTMMAKPGDHPDEHLGEAETLTLIASRNLHAMIATDDKNAAAVAHPIPTANTWQLLRTCFRAGHVTLDEGKALWRLFGAAGGFLPFYIATEDEFVGFMGQKVR